MLDNRLVAAVSSPDYCLAMAGIAFRERVLAAMEAKNMKKAELARRAGLPYHRLDKFLKGTNKTTATENAIAIAHVLGIKVDDEQEYEELHKVFVQLDEGQRRFLLASARGLLSQDHE